MRQSVTVTSALCLLSLVLTAESFSWPHWGRCPSLPVQQNFNLKGYTGQWFEQAGYHAESVEGNKRCVYANYTLDEPSGTLIAQNRGIDQNSNKWGGIDGSAKPEDPSKEEGRLIVTFKLSWWLTVSGRYWVLGTDYDSLTVVYNCDNWLLFFHYYTIWYLGREQTFESQEDEDEYFSKANLVISTIGFDPSIMKKSSQENCNV